MNKTDILIIGTGIAGLSLAIKTAKKRKDLSITVMTKATADMSNTKHAQGGIAVVMDRLTDSFESHIEDTLKSGGGLCDAEIVKMVVGQAPERLQELIDLGVEFDKSDKYLDLALEGGHSRPRIVHHKDNTGLEIEKTLLRAARSLENITLLENHYVIDLITETTGYKAGCVGAFYFDDKNAVKYIRSKATVLSTGGCGQVFGHTTNAPVATGDGVAIAHRAKAKIKDMHLIQFHPTAMYEPGENPCFLLSEALRGFGAHVVNQDGKRFLFAYDIRGELATRDIVSSAIAAELQKTGKKHSYLDCRHLDREAFKNRFESIYAHCSAKKIDPMNELIPIVPVAHYQCGGITVNKYAQTTVNGLFAVGECANTGLHGKNRLASNSLLEAVVFAHQAAEKICSMIDDVSHSRKVYVNKFKSLPQTVENKKITEITLNIKAALDQFYVDRADETALYELGRLWQTGEQIFGSENISKPMVELINMLTVASLVIEHATNNQVTTLNN